MDSDDSDDELFPILPESQIRGDAFIYNDPLLVSGILRAVVEEDLEKIKKLVSEGNSLNINDNNGNTPLHVAVIKNNIEILKFLLAQDHIELDSRNWNDRQTPLYIAVKSGYFESARMLIDRGADVNLRDDDEVTPLHRSVQYPSLTELLIKNGALINTTDRIYDTPLHVAVSRNCVESIYILLYYGADPNVLGCNDLTPFMKAVINENLEIQEILFEYIVDYNIFTFDGCSLLSLALTHESPFVEEILKRGGEVDVTAVKASVRLGTPDKFKLIWGLFKPENVHDFNILNYIYYKTNNRALFSSYLDVIFKQSDESFLENLAETVTSYTYIVMLFDWSRFNYLSKEEITKLTCLLLSYGFQSDTGVIMMVYDTMGYCELFKILLYMDYDHSWSGIYDITSRVIFDIHTDIENIHYKLKTAGVVMNNDMLKIIESSLKYWVYPPLIDRAVNEYYDVDFSLRHQEDTFARRDEIRKRFSNVPKLPSLLQLARDHTRKYIVNKFNIKSTCQYYTFVNHMDMSIAYKKILSFETPIYKF